MGDRGGVISRAAVVGLAMALLGVPGSAVAAPFDPKGGAMERADANLRQEARAAGLRTAGVRFVDGVAYSTRVYSNAGGRLQFGDARCPRGWEVLGGGVATQSGNQFLNATQPLGARGWRAWVNNLGGSPAAAAITAICLR